MSKYQPLSERLAGHPGPEWRASFAELEEVLGFPLPKAARSGGAWWQAGSDKPHARAWSASGWQVGDVDHAVGEVTFRRPVSEAALQGAPDPVSELQPSVTQVTSERRPRRWGIAAAVAGGVAVLAGVGAVVLRGRGRGKS